MKDGEGKSVLLFISRCLGFLIRKGFIGATKWGDNMNHPGTAGVKGFNLVALYNFQNLFHFEKKRSRRFRRY